MTDMSSTGIEPFKFVMRNRHTGEEKVIVSGGNQVGIICPDCRGYMGTPPFDSGSATTKYCDCWELVKTKKRRKGV